METRPLPSITALPILVKARDGLSVDGAGYLFSEGTENAGLHVVSKAEASAYVVKWKQAGSKEWKLFGGVTAIREAIRVKNWGQFQQGLDLAELWIPHFWGEDEIQSLRASRSWKDAGITYADLMSNLLHTAHFMLWYSMKDGGRLKSRPGLFCPDWEVAVHALMAMGGLRKCAKPGCEEVFIPRDDDPATDSRNSQIYCSDACGNAVRVARSKKKARRKSSH